MAERGARARDVGLLARVESAREGRCRAELAEIEAAWRYAARIRAAADQAVLDAREGRRSTLCALYAALPGSHAAFEIHDVRGTEQALLEREREARVQAIRARASEDEAGRRLAEKQLALAHVTARRLRREQLAERLAGEQRHARNEAEEATISDELADRVAASGR